MDIKTKRKKIKADDHGKTQKKRRLVLTPRVIVEPILSDASTLPWNCSGDNEQIDIQGNETEATVGDITMMEMETQGIIVSDSDSDDSDDDTAGKAVAELRDDMPIVTKRWEDEEVDALVTALNVNRDAIKFYFVGPGGGKDVKKQAWIDVARYVNDVADTHRTVNQCKVKAKDYTQRAKAKYNKLRYAVTQTGRGSIKDKLKLNDREGKALDYLREEAVKGIPGIEAMDIGGPKLKKPSSKNKALLWTPDRAGKPNYNMVKMERKPIPTNYKDKNKRRLAREEKERNKKKHEVEMKAERKKERLELKKKKRLMKADKRQKCEELKSAKKEKRKKEIRRKAREEHKKAKEQRRLHKLEKAQKRLSRKMKKEGKIKRKAEEKKACN